MKTFKALMEEMADKKKPPAKPGKADGKNIRLAGYKAKEEVANTEPVLKMDSDALRFMHTASNQTMDGGTHA